MEEEGGPPADERVRKRRRIRELLPPEKRSLVDPEIESGFFPAVVYSVDDRAASEVVLALINAETRAVSAETRAASAETRAASAETRADRAETVAAQEREQRVIAETMTNQLLAKQVWTTGLPSIVMSGGSGAAAGSQHSAVAVSQVPLTRIDGLEWRNTDPSAVYLDLHEGRHDLDYGSEADVTTFVRATLKDIFKGSTALRALNIRLNQEMTVVSLRPGSIIFSRNSLPIGYCEVKRPALNDPVNDYHVLGQAFDYAMELRHLHGLVWPFVILTTFKHWRVLTLDDAACRYAAGLSEVDDGAVAGSPPPPAVPTGGRRALVSEVVEGQANPDVASFLASALLKMAHSPVVGASQFRPELTTQGMNWVEWTPARRLNAFPVNPRVPFVRVQHLGTGRDGSCWLVAKGEQHFVLKVVQSASPMETDASMAARAEAEAGRWRQLWHVQGAQAVTVMGRAALVLPFVQIFQSPQEYLENIDDVRQAVQAMADERHVHNDLDNGDGSIKWWHFGVLEAGPGFQRRVVAVDLSDMTVAGSVREATQAMSGLPIAVARPRW